MSKPAKAAIGRPGEAIVREPPRLPERLGPHGGGVHGVPAHRHVCGGEICVMDALGRIDMTDRRKPLSNARGDKI